MKTKIVALFLISTFILTSGFGCKLPSSQTKKAMEPITLEYWRVFDDSDAFEEIIADYNARHSFITINYKKLLFEEYEEELINALAEDRGPDIFSIQNTWIPDYQNKISAMPPQTTLVFPVTKGTLKKEVVPELRSVKSLTLKDLKEKFVDVVYDDVVLEEDGNKSIYGLPLSIDTLAMYYNKDLLNNAGIVEAPEYWNKAFQQAVKKLTKQNSLGSIIQSGVALGGAENIERSADILSLLMMQNGAVMADEKNRITFHSMPKNLNHHPGLGALEFYTDFSNPGKEVYCWTSNMINSLDMFIQGKLAIMFGYAYHMPIIKARAPKLNFEVAKMPQIENNPIINYPNYWVEVVSTKSKYQNEAW
ncbi:extracellular solute-binding protein, partial [Candidatus Falkowbacteria bacterium]|nr:extracellular solute-binding protein [Candidatus Falkowbacteria bacterium]